MGKPKSDRPRCHAVTSETKRPCKNKAIAGHVVCLYHGGNAPQTQKVAKYREAIAEMKKWMEDLGKPMGQDLHPVEHMLMELYESAGNVAVLRDKVRELSSEGEDGGEKNGRQFHLLVEWYNNERERHARMAKLCLDAGIAERQVRLAEQQAEMVAKVISNVIDELDIPMTKAAPIIRKHLMELKPAS